MSAVRIGLTLPSFREDGEPLVAVARAAEAAGLDGVFAYDHLFRHAADGALRPALEFAATMGALAAETRAITIGSLVARATLRPAAVLANVFDTARRIAGKRVVAGLGAGDEESRTEMETFGYEFGTAITRLHAFRDALPVIRERMAIGNPPPVRGRIPIMIGGGGEKVMLRLVAEHADIWHGFGTPDEYRHKSGVLDAHCAAIGRDPAEIERSVMFEAHELGGDDLFDAYVDAGATYFFYSAPGPEYDLDGLRLLLDWRARR